MGQDLEIKRFLSAFMRRWWVLVTLSLVVGVATYFVTPNSGPEFRAFSVLLFEDPNQQPSYALPFGTGLNAGGNSLSNQVQAVRSPQVIREAASKVLGNSFIGGVPPDSADILSEISTLGKVLEIRQVGNSNRVTIAAAAETGELAAIRANAMAEAFIEYTTASQAETVSNRLESISRQLEVLQDARNDASSVDPQSIAGLEDQVAVVGEGISALLDQLKSLRKSGDAGELSFNVLSSLSETLGDVITDVDNIEANLLLLGERKTAVTGSGAGQLITSGLFTSADFLDRGSLQLERLAVEDPASSQFISAEFSAGIEQSVSEISEFLWQAADNLSEINETLLVTKGLLSQARTYANDATDSIRSATNLVNDALSNPGLQVNENRLRAARDSLSSLDDDIIVLISQMRSLSEGEGAAGQAGDRQQIANQFMAVQVEINVLVVDIRAVRGQETGSLNIGSLQTAEVQAQVANNEIENAVTALLSVGQTNAFVSVSEIESKLRLISNEVLGLPAGVTAILSAEEGGEQLGLELLAEATAVEASLEIAVLQIQARRVSETDTDAFIPLFVAESRAIKGLAGLTVIKNDIENMADPSGTSLSLIALKSFGDEMALVARNLRLLDSQFGGSLELGTISESQLAELSDEAGALNAALGFIIRSIPPLRNTINNAELYGNIRNAESRALDAQRELSLVISQLSQLTDAEFTSIGPASISDIRDRSAQITETVASAKADLDSLNAGIRPSGTVPAARLVPLRDRILAAGEIVFSLSQNMASIRAQESDVENRARLISVEQRLVSSALALTTVSDGIEQLLGRPGPLVDQAVTDASDEARLAGQNFNSAAQRLRDIRESINAGSVIRPADLVVIGQELRDVERNVLAVSASLTQAEASELLPAIQADLAFANVGSDDLGVTIDAVAAEFEALGRPSDVETTLYAQLLDSQRQLQLGRLIFDNPTVSIRQTAVSARDTTSDKSLSNGLMGLAAGFLLGMVIVFIVEYMDKRLRGQDDIKRQLGLAPIGVIPIATGDWNPHPQITADDPPSAFSESLRMVRTAVEVGREQESAQVLMVTSPNEGDGKTTIALNLARTMAMENKKVLLVDANLNTPEVALAFQLGDVRGLSDALKTDSPPDDYVVEVDGVHILPGGDAVDNPADILATRSFREFLQNARKHYDVVILDCPPAVGYPDTIVLARNADGVIITYRARHTSTTDAENANESMQSVGVPTVGVVLNMAHDGDSGVVYPKMHRTSPHPAPLPKWRLPWMRNKRWS